MLRRNPHWQRYLQWSLRHRWRAAFLEAPPYAIAMALLFMVLMWVEMKLWDMTPPNTGYFAYWAAIWFAFRVVMTPLVQYGRAKKQRKAAVLHQAEISDSM